MVAGLCRRTCLFVLRLSFVLEFYDNSSREFIIVGERFVLRALALAHVAGLFLEVSYSTFSSFFSSSFFPLFGVFLTFLSRLLGSTAFTSALLCSLLSAL